MIIELVHCLCGELMKKEQSKNNEIPVCWKCQCDSNEELLFKIKERERMKKAK